MFEQSIGISDFDTAGSIEIPELEAGEDHSIHLSALRMIRAQVAKKIPEACGCKHEIPSAALRAEKEKDNERPSEEMDKGALCPESVRLTNPNCAHVQKGEHFHDPDPYGNEIHALKELRILDWGQWWYWSEQMKDRIADIDSQASEDAGKGLYKLPIVEIQQQPNVQELKRIQKILLTIIDQVIDKITTAMSVPVMPESQAVEVETARVSVI